MIDRRDFARLATLAAAATAAAPAARAVTRRKIVKPRKLVAGDSVGLVSPASAAFEDDSVNVAKEQLEALGFKVKAGAHAYDRHGYFAGPDRDRAADINRFFADKELAGIVCYTGGWGSPRVLPYLDFNVIAANPKVFIGYSDVTALLNTIHQRTGLVTFHGPVAGSGFDAYTLDNFRKVVMTSEPAGLLAQPPKPQNDLIDRRNRVLRLAPGKTTGRLAGGNLTMIATAMGTPYQLDTTGAIVFLEDVREELYRVDRMLTQLALGGLFDRAVGVVFGRCTNCDSTGPGFSLEEILRDRFGSMPIPVISGLSFGHIEQKLTMPVGVTATLDADAGTLTLDEAAVEG
jgi:muramoyltetrapeptide carboxypeptidase